MRDTILAFTALPKALKQVPKFSGSLIPFSD